MHLDLKSAFEAGKPNGSLRVQAMRKWREREMKKTRNGKNIRKKKLKRETKLKTIQKRPHLGIILGKSYKTYKYIVSLFFR